MICRINGISVLELMYVAFLRHHIFFTLEDDSHCSFFIQKFFFYSRQNHSLYFPAFDEWPIPHYCSNKTPLIRVSIFIHHHFQAPKEVKNFPLQSCDLKSIYAAFLKIWKTVFFLVLNYTSQFNQILIALNSTSYWSSPFLYLATSNLYFQSTAARTPDAS